MVYAHISVHYCAHPWIPANRTLSSLFYFKISCRVNTYTPTPHTDLLKGKMC